MLRPLLLAALASAALVAAGCGDDDEEKKKRDGRAGDVQRYCELSRAFDRAGEQLFKPLEQENASAKEFEAAEKKFVQGHEADLNELQRVAPEPIRNDTETLVAAQRAQAGLGPPVNEAKAGAAEERVKRFEKRNCS
jgi:hypothetical protein